MGFKMKVCIFIDGVNFFYGDMSFDFEKYVYSLINKKILNKNFYRKI